MAGNYSTKHLQRWFGCVNHCQKRLHFTKKMYQNKLYFYYTAMQGPKAECLCAYLKSKQILRFGFAQQHTHSLIPGYDVNNIILIIL